MADSTYRADNAYRYGMLPADSAFTSGHKAYTAYVASDRCPGYTSPDVGEQISDAILVIMTIIFIIYIRKAIDILPQTAGCLLRWKENLNLEFNVRSSRERNRMAAILYPTACVIIYRYGIAAPASADKLHPAAMLAIIAGAVAVFLAVRLLLFRIMRPSGANPRLWDTSRRALYTYFIPAAILSVLVSGIMELCGTGTDAIRDSVTYVSAAIWIIFLIRQLQIFRNSCSLFSAILYLCTLEILPMAILVTAAILS